jgi:hypothetical protein
MMDAACGQPAGIEFGKALSGVDDAVARRHIVARRTHVVAAVDCCVHRDGNTVGFAVFLYDDGIEIIRKDGAGEDTYAATLGCRPAEGVAGSTGPADGQAVWRPAVDVSGTQRIAVHR